MGTSDMTKGPADDCSVLQQRSHMFRHAGKSGNNPLPVLLQKYTLYKSTIQSARLPGRVPLQRERRSHRAMVSGNGKAVPAVGIDLGTTFSVIAHVDAFGQPRTILNSEGDATLPSAVLFDRDSVIVGKEALRAAAQDPDSVVRFAKREMGNRHYSRTIAGRSDWSPEMIQSFILQRLKDDAEKVIGPFTKAVITVPAYFNDSRRKATEECGK